MEWAQVALLEIALSLHEYSTQTHNTHSSGSFAISTLGWGVLLQQSLISVVTERPVQAAPVDQSETWRHNHTRRFNSAEFVHQPRHFRAQALGTWHCTVRCRRIMATLRRGLNTWRCITRELSMPILSLCFVRLKSAMSEPAPAACAGGSGINNFSFVRYPGNAVRPFIALLKTFFQCALNCPARFIAVPTEDS